jgi:trimethylamine--corrinoid protein Co-methyltransferase
MIGTGMSVSYEQLVVDNEMAKFVRKYIGGVEVSSDTIGLDAIKRVGHHKDFMMDEHTFKYLKSKEYMDYDVSNRDIFANWVSKGKPSIMDNAREMANDIIVRHKPPALSSQKHEKISEVITDFEGSFKK